MSACAELLAAGPFATIQDLGRPGHVDQGIGPGGAMDRLALRAANALVGNAQGAAAIETAGAPLVLRVESGGAVAVTGAPVALRVDGLPVPGWWAEPLRPGAVIEIRPTRRGVWTYLALAGGFACAPVLGSASTDRKMGIGGPDGGRPLQPGTRLALGPAGPRAEGWGMAPPEREGPIRAMPAREHDRFDEASRAAFWAGDWRIGAASDRQGYAVEGPPLRTRAPLSLLSYGLVPGTIQVPPSGRPVVQMAEANTCGGYPKMGVVIGADLGRLAQMRPGEAVRFERVDRAAALAARAGQEAWLAALARARGAE